MGLFRSGMSKTRTSFFGRIGQLFVESDIDETTWEDMEAMLLQADLGVNSTQYIVKHVRETVEKQGLRTAKQVQQVLKDILRGMMSAPPPLNLQGRMLSVLLIVGVNGSGKTTTIAKLSNQLKKEGRKVIIAAGDTFRAAAVEQLEKWGERIGVPVISNKTNKDAGSVVFDATSAARARKLDTLIIDTAGRLHNNYNLMEELAKIKAVSAKTVHEAPHEVILVLDGTTGQNALQQAKKFSEVVDVTGIIVTKLDGTAKGGMIFSIFNDLKIPIHYIGLGEGLDDLVRFDPDSFIDSLFDE